MGTSLKRVEEARVIRFWEHSQSLILFDGGVNMVWAVFRKGTVVTGFTNRLGLTKIDDSIISRGEGAIVKIQGSKWRMKAWEKKGRDKSEKILKEKLRELWGQLNNKSNDSLLMNFNDCKNSSATDRNWKVERWRWSETLMSQISTGTTRKCGIFLGSRRRHFSTL